MGRLGRFALVVCVAATLALTACVGGTARDAADTSAGTSSSRGGGSVLPVGMFGMDQARVARVGQVVQIDFPGDCGSLLDVFDAGQWSTTTIIAPTGALHEYLLTIRLGDQNDLAWLYPSTVSCHATITEPSSQKFSFTGREEESGTAQFLPFQCQKEGDAASDPVNFSGLYDAPGGFHFMVSAMLPAKKGSTAIDPDGVEVSVLHGSAPVIELMGTMLTAAQGDADSEDESVVPDGAGYYPSDSFEGTVTITSMKPLAGTVKLTGLNDNEGGDDVAVTAGFRCGE